VASAC
jgi:hypothetical protein